MRDVLGVLGADAVAGGEVRHARAAHVVEQRRVAVEVLAEEDALAQARLGDGDRLEAAVLEHRLDDHRAGEDEVGAGVLDALDVAALVGGHAASCSTRSSSAPARRSRSPGCRRARAGRPAAWIAEARLRIVPPMPTSWRPARGSQSASCSSVSRTCARSALRAFFVGGSSSARKCSVIRTAPSGQEPSRPGWRLRTSTSCSEPPPRSSTAPSARVVELTAAR